jgi:hypothetical protein
VYFTAAVTGIHDCDSLLVLSFLCICDLLFLIRSIGTTCSTALALPTAPESHNHDVVHGFSPTGGDARHAHLIQTGTCQRNTTCSWLQQPDPPQSGTYQQHTMCSCPRRPDLSSHRVNKACMRRCKEINMSIASVNLLECATLIKNRRLGIDNDG